MYAQIFKHSFAALFISSEAAVTSLLLEGSRSKGPSPQATSVLKSLLSLSLTMEAKFFSLFFCCFSMLL